MKPTFTSHNLGSSFRNCDSSYPPLGIRIRAPPNYYFILPFFFPIWLLGDLRTQFQFFIPSVSHCASKFQMVWPIKILSSTSAATITNTVLRLVRWGIHVKRARLRERKKKVYACFGMSFLLMSTYRAFSLRSYSSAILSISNNNLSKKKKNFHFKWEREIRNLVFDSSWIRKVACNPNYITFLFASKHCGHIWKPRACLEYSFWMKNNYLFPSPCIKAKVQSTGLRFIPKPSPKE